MDTYEVPKNYNALALMGHDVTDQEYADSYDLPSRAVNTPEINELMLNKMYEENITTYKDQGKSDNEAKAMANENRQKAKRDIDAALARKGMY